MVMPLSLKTLPAYLRFMQLAESFDYMSLSSKLDHVERELLDKLILAYYNREFPLMGDLTSLKSIASQATLHSRVKSLIAKGFIDIVADDDDSRKKHLVPTKLALMLYQNLSDALVKATA
jgi:DNA-binding MarR family transcriptional regulator